MSHAHVITSEGFPNLNDVLAECLNDAAIFGCTCDSPAAVIAIVFATNTIGCSIMHDDDCPAKDEPCPN